jgi:hypothetical protein
VVEGGAFSSGPAVASFGSVGRVELAGRGSDGAVRVSTSLDGGATWGAFRRISGVVTSAPAISAIGVSTEDGPTAITIVARGRAGQLYRADAF